MSTMSSKQDWEEFRRLELANATPLLRSLGFELDATQVHIGGERYVSAGRKLVLLGTRQGDGLRVVVKISRDPHSVAEIRREVRYRQLLERIPFAYHVFQSPPVVLYDQVQGFTVLVTAFVEQERPFLSRPLAEQFFFALKAFEGQEGAHGTTFGHVYSIRRAFGLWNAARYRATLARYLGDVASFPGLDGQVARTLAQGYELLEASAEIVERYSGFLTHWDFVPHNFRVRGHDLYLLDHSSIRFGSKYEGWARFVNFMSLYNPALEGALVGYVSANRGAAELLALKLMRVYRLAELVWHYVGTLRAAEGNLRTLNQLRVGFWAEALRVVLADRTLASSTIEAYRGERDRLREDDEKLRQVDLH